jgi:hypothetical protein
VISQPHLFKVVCGAMGSRMFFCFDSVNFMDDPYNCGARHAKNSKTQTEEIGIKLIGKKKTEIGLTSQLTRNHFDL